MRLELSLLSALLLSFAGTAAADTFTLTVDGGVDTFMLPASPVSSSSSDFDFAFASVPINESGVDVMRQIDFFTAATGGGLLIQSSDGPDFNGQGDQLYTGLTTQPTFLLGTFNLVGADSGVLTISSSTATPELPPIVLLGSGLIGVVVLSRKTVST